MKRFLIYPICILLVGCGVDNSWPDEIAPYVASFEQATGSQVKSVVVEFVPHIDGAIAARCMGVFITIDKAKWDNWVLFPVLREILVWHELGHCFEKKAHDDTTENGCPTTYMSTYLPSINCAQKIRDSFLLP